MSIPAVVLRGLLVVSLTVLTTAPLSTPAMAADTAIACLMAAPQIYDHNVSAPDPTTVLVRQSIYYVAGTALDVSLTIPPCNSLSAVLVDAASVPLRETSIDSPPFSYTMLSDQDLQTCQLVNRIRECHSLGRRRVTLRLSFDNAGRGDSHSVAVRVGAGMGRTRIDVAFSFTIVMVRTIGGDIAISLSEAEIRNQLISSIWNRFGQAGTYDSNGDAPGGNVLYDPLYSKETLRIQNDGIHFRWQAKAKVDHWCDPLATMTGRFTLQLSNGQINVVWLEGPTAHLDFAWYCDLAGGYLQWFFTIIYSGFVENDVANMVQAQINSVFQAQINSLQAQLNSTGYPLDANLLMRLVRRIDTLPGELRVSLDTTQVPGNWKWVSIAVPYRPLPPGSPAGRGFVLNPGDIVITTASGLAHECASDSSIPSPTCVYMGVGTSAVGASPQGLLNASRPQTIPVLDTTQPNYGLVGDRVEAYNALDLVQRDPHTLPFPQGNVGALIARFATGSGSPWSWTVGLGSALAVPADGVAWLNFGVNDRPPLNSNLLLYAYGIGSIRVAIVWVD